ncbi:hypothetical protein L9F63_008106, partial [Diploptera punctata]
EHYYQRKTWRTKEDQNIGGKIKTIFARFTSTRSDDYYSTTLIFNEEKLRTKIMRVNFPLVVCSQLLVTMSSAKHHCFPSSGKNTCNHI